MLIFPKLYVVMTYETINFENLKQFVYTTVSNASYLCFMKKYCYRIFILEF
jgi:hypothetical protein